jgi:hypothetical protein
VPIRREAIIQKYHGRDESQETILDNSQIKKKTIQEQDWGELRESDDDFEYEIEEF